MSSHLSCRFRTGLLPSNLTFSASFWYSSKYPFRLYDPSTVSLHLIYFSISGPSNSSQSYSLYLVSPRSKFLLAIFLSNVTIFSSDGRTVAHASHPQLSIGQTSVLHILSLSFICAGRDFVTCYRERYTLFADIMLFVLPLSHLSRKLCPQGSKNVPCFRFENCLQGRECNHDL